MSTVEAESKSLPASAARMVAVEILLADPEALADDVLDALMPERGRLPFPRRRRS